MPNLIVDFPNEILIQVFETLSNRDIDGLHKIPEFRHRLQSLIVVVCEDTAKSNFRYIKNKVSFADWTPDGNWSDVYRVIVDIDCYSEAAVKRLCDTTDFAQGHVSVFGHYFREEMQTLFEEPIGTHAKTITMEESDSIWLSDCVVNPELIEFPGVISLHLRSCTLSNLSGSHAKFKSSNWTDIDISDCGSLEKTIDYKDTPCLETLKLACSRGGVKTFEDISFSKLKQCTFGSETSYGILEHLRRASFEKLEELAIHSSMLSEFCDLYLPRAKSIKLLSSGFAPRGMRISNVYAPSLVTLEIVQRYLRDFHHCDFGTGLQTVTLFCSDFDDQEEQAGIIDYSCFANVTHFRTDDCIDALRYQPDVSALEIRAWDHTRFYEEFDVPHLQSLKISSSQSYLSNLPFTAPALMHLEIQCRTIPSDLSSLEQALPSLLYLAVRTYQYPEQLKLTHSRLEYLSITKDYLGKGPYCAVDFDCKLDSLRYLSLDLGRDTRDLLADDPKSHFSLQAPELTETHLSGLRLTEVDLSSYPSLEVFHLKHGAQSLKFGPASESMRSMHLDCNMELDYIEPAVFPNLVKLTAWYTPAVNGAEIELPLLEKTVQNYKATFELLNPDDYYVDQTKGYPVLKEPDPYDSYSESGESFGDDEIGAPAAAIIEYLSTLPPDQVITVADFRNIADDLVNGSADDHSVSDAFSE